MDISNLEQLRGSTVIDVTGDKIGKVEEIYLDRDTNQPEWALVNTGMFGTRSTFVPLEGASQQGDGLQVQFDKAQVKDAPNIDASRELSQQDESELYSYYGMSYGEYRSDSGLPDDSAGVGVTDTGFSEDRDADNRDGTVGYDVSGPTTDNAMTRSEEQLRVGTTQQEAGRVRLRKWVETENVTETVPVSREEARIEREPITDANVGEATAGPAISEEEHEVVLSEEVPVVEKTATPVERVRLDTEQVTEQAQVSEDVRKERIDVDGDVDTGTRDSGYTDSERNL